MPYFGHDRKVILLRKYIPLIKLRGRLILELNTDGSQTRSLIYNPSLDGLRAVAVVMVILFHTRFGGVSGGFVGVDVFFVLSGYLITSILRGEVSSTGSVDLMSFYWNRALRLYPPLVMMLVAWAILMPLQYPDLNTLRNGAIALFYLSDYFLAFGTLSGHLGHTWSLAVEEHFYMIWPLIILATRKMSNQLLFVGLVWFFVIAVAWRIVDFALWDSWQMTYHRFDTRLAGLTLGAAIAVLPERFDSAFYGKSAIIALSIILGAGLTLRWGSHFALSTGMTVTHLAAACVILGVRDQTLLISRILSARPIVYLGLLSYSIYLWHFPIAKVLLQYTSPKNTFVTVVLASVILAALSFELVEKPLRKYRRGQRLKAARD